MASKAQLTIDDVLCISITDRINMNYSWVKSHTFEIRFNDSIEVWLTGQITMAEFRDSFYVHNYDSLYRRHKAQSKSQGETEDGLSVTKSVFESLKKAYQQYQDTVSPQFIHYTSKSVIKDLLVGIQDTNYSRKDFLKSNDIPDTVTTGNRIEMTSYYPLVGFTVISKLGDTIVVYNNGQQDLMIPWLHKKSGQDLYNPLINLSLDAILPDDLNYNKHRLTIGLTEY